MTPLKKQTLLACAYLRHAPLALSVGFAIGASASRVDAHRLPEPQTSSARGNSIIVTDCDDAGAGSFRDAVGAAASGDTIDLTQLTCSTITLTSGAIGVSQDDLAIVGPGSSMLSVDGGGESSILRHSGSGTLSITGVTMTHGYYNHYYGHGGCIFSPANVALYDVTVSNCVVKGGYARGGGIFAVLDLTLSNSVVTGNLADGGTLTSSGGGFLVGGYLLVEYSTISNNVAYTAPPPDGQFSVGGAADTFGDVMIRGSTISGNQARNVAGLVFEAHGTPAATMINSTVSGNVVTEGGPFGGVYAGIPLAIYNSTIAFNTGTGLVSAGRVSLQSAIIADNTGTDLRLFTGGTVGGANNLVVKASVVPPDTIRSCPMLDRLADNGGVTLTHALLHASPAIDVGSNATNSLYDQRGIGFARVFGSSADIGAFESQGAPDERVFFSGFETGCDE